MRVYDLTVLGEATFQKEVLLLHPGGKGARKEESWKIVVLSCAEGESVRGQGLRETTFFIRTDQGGVHGQ